MDFDKQIRSIRYAIKELRRELVKAEETNNTEWEIETIEHIANLELATKTIEAMEALALVMKG